MKMKKEFLIGFCMLLVIVLSFLAYDAYKGFQVGMGV